MLRQFFSKAALVCFLAGVPVLSPLVMNAQSINQSDKLPIDSKITMGKLPNGLTYYIRPNGKPEKKVELRLVVKAGSILETEEQQGLAHFMEHMNFNGTTHFPKNKLVDFLQSIGVEFGADLNAYTSFDETVYILPIPTDKPGNLESGFQVIEDWAHNADLHDDDIDSERGVVLEESRGRKGADDRMMQKYLPKILAGSHYANRLPIGKDEILKNFKYETLRSFYKDWYRPNLMAVAVVGDISVAEAEKLIKKHFSGLKNPAPAKERKYYDIKPYKDASAMVVTDKEASNILFQIMFSARPETPQSTIKDYREDLIKSLFSQILNNRLQELTQSAQPPFAYAGTYLGSYVHNYEGFSMTVVPTTDINTSIKAAIGELVKIQDFGLTQSELELAKKKMINNIDKQYNERNTTESGRLVGEMVRNFLSNEPIPGIEKEHEYYNSLLPGITLQEVNAEAKKWLNKKDNSEYVALLTGPSDSKEVKLPTDVELLGMVKGAFEQKVQANAEKVVSENLLDKKPTPGKIMGTSVDKELSTTTYTLSNGVKVSIKKTDFKSDEIVLTAIKKGGANNYGPDDKSNTNFMPQVIGAMGYGNFTPTALKDALAGKSVRVNTNMTELTDNINASSSVKDFESMLQLLYLQLTAPKKDEALYKGFVNTTKTQLQFLGSNPQVAFIDTLGKALYNNDPRRPIMVPTIGAIERLNMDRVLEIYKTEFGNADGFHFFIVGNVDEEKVKGLMETYIASLPVKHEKPTYRDNGLRSVNGHHTLNVYKGQEPKSLILSFFKGEIPYSEELALKTELIGEILTIKVLEDVREQMGAMYSGGFNANLTKEPFSRYSIIGQFPCGPENVDAILKKINEEVADIKRDGPSQKDLDKVKQAQKEKRKEGIKTNGFWTGELENLMFWDRERDNFLHWDQMIDKITVADIKATANKLFDGKNTFTAVLYPETVSPVAQPKEPKVQEPKERKEIDKSAVDKAGSNNNPNIKKAIAK